jgi:hypothetical protein
MLKKTWSHKNDNIKILDMRNKVKTKAVIAGISVDRGLESYLVKDKSIKSEEYIEFLRQLRTIYPEDRLVLFLDNLQIHKSRVVVPAYAELDIHTIFCAPYSP